MKEEDFILLARLKFDLWNSVKWFKNDKEKLYFVQLKGDCITENVIISSIKSLESVDLCFRR